MLTEREKIAHLLRRFALGASERELDFYGKNGLAGAINTLLNYEAVDPGLEPDPELFSNGQGVVNVRVMQGIWGAKLVTTRRPIEEKLTLFWHNHFATASMKVDSGWAMNKHIGTLRAYGLGNFRDLLRRISQDPAMIYWLDGQLNVVGKPNENFGREVMELFTLGIGHYTERDIQEAARAFTGWTYGGIVRTAGEQARAPRRTEGFKFVPERHDGGKKTVLGKTGNLSGEDVLEILCMQPQTARFIAAKMWAWFAGPAPSDALLDRLANAFQKSGLEIKALVRAIMESPEFYGESVVRKLIKNPIDFVIPVLRQLGFGPMMIEGMREAIANPIVNEQNGLNIRLLAASRPGFAAIPVTASMGMEIMNPPDVSGWKTGNYWITSATMVERAKFADTLFARPGGGGAGNRKPSFAADLTELFPTNVTPTALVDGIASILDCNLSSASRKVLVTAAQEAGSGVNAKSLAVLKLLFVAPEFQFC